MPIEAGVLEGPVFVVGMNGSGTTMLSDSLGRHPDLFMFPRETYVLPHLLRHGERFGDLYDAGNLQAFIRHIGQQAAYWRANGRRRLQVRELDIASTTVPGVIDAVYRHFAARKGKRRWGDKTPMYVQHIPILAAAFPAAKFVHLYRDGRDVAQSLHRRWGLEPRLSIYRWRETMSLVGTGQAVAEGRCLELSYESLTAAPEENLQALCRFLGLPFFSGLLSSSMPHMGADKAPKQGRIVRNSGKWKSYFGKDTIVAMEAIAGEALLLRGYAVAHYAGSATPSALLRARWYSHDKVLRLADLFLGPSRRSYLLRMKRLAAAVKHARSNRY